MKVVWKDACIPPDVLPFPELPPGQAWGSVGRELPVSSLWALHARGGGADVAPPTEGVEGKARACDALHLPWLRLREVDAERWSPVVNALTQLEFPLLSEG
jgi:hypothetical protein